MIITCEECSTQFVLDDALIKPEGSKVRCGNCRHVFTAFPAETRDTIPAVDIPDPADTEEQPPAFDDPQFQDELDFDISQDDDFGFNSAPQGEDQDLEESQIDFSEIEFDEPEFEQTPPETPENEEAFNIENRDFDEDGLDFDDFEADEPEPDSQDFKLEQLEDTPSLSMETQTDTADIEISFDKEDDAAGIELEPMTFDMDDDVIDDETMQEASPIDDFEPETQTQDAPEPEFDNDPQADLTIEDDNQDLPTEPEDDLIDEPAQPLDGMIEKEPEDQAADTDEQIDQTDQTDQAVPDQDKFVEYDKVLDQEAEPEETSTDIAYPEVDENLYSPEPSSLPAEDKTATAAQILPDQAPESPVPSAHSVRQKRGAKKKKGLSLPVKILLVLCLLVLAAYVAILRLGGSVSGLSDIKIPFVSEWLAGNQAPAPLLSPVPDEPSINGRFVSNKSAGDLFIVTGRVTNPSSSTTAVSYIQIKGTLMKKDNSTAGVQTAYCGNIIPEETLKSGNISDITRQMEIKQGNQDTNVNIKPGASVMFMLVFSKLPEDLANFTVAVNGFEPAAK